MIDLIKKVAQQYEKDKEQIELAKWVIDYVDKDITDLVTDKEDPLLDVDNDETWMLDIDFPYIINGHGNATIFRYWLTIFSRRYHRHFKTFDNITYEFTIGKFLDFKMDKWRMKMHGIYALCVTRKRIKYHD